MDIKTKTLKALELNVGKENPKCLLKIFNPYGAGTWYLTEYYESDQTFFGYCDLGLGFAEWGYVSMADFDTCEQLEVDRHWTPIPSNEVPGYHKGLIGAE